MAGQWAWLGACADLCTAAALPILARLPNLVPPAATPPSGPARARSSGPLRRLITAYALLGFGYVVTATFIVAMARQQSSAPFIDALCWLVVGATAAPSVPLGHWLAKRYGSLAVMRGAFGLEALGVLLAGCGHSTLTLIAGGACLGATFLSITALIITLARDAAGPAADATVGWMTAAFGSGQLLGPFVAGRVAQWSGGFALPSALAAGLLLVAAVVLPRNMAPAARPA
ncbi:MAG: YbfB/YjiJ family MFS transporter [Gammaproteobacteria bacterium]|nr:YbfB/YjiJ family MFS transporter [Gammaproteobacteria bacterium]